MPYSELERIENINIPDSWVKYNKIGTGSGEARLYVGRDSEKHVFFYIYQSINIYCFCFKKRFSTVFK